MNDNGFYDLKRQNCQQFKSKIYISKYLGTVQDESLNQIKQYDKPVKYFFNVRDLSGDSEIREFGELSDSMKVAVVTNKYKYMDKFKAFDLAYLDGIEPENEIDYGDNANYRIYDIRNQNTIIKIFFIKLVKNQA